MDLLFAWFLENEPTAFEVVPYVKRLKQCIIVYIIFLCFVCNIILNLPDWVRYLAPPSEQFVTTLLSIY